MLWKKWNFLGCYLNIDSWYFEYRFLWFIYAYLVNNVFCPSVCRSCNKRFKPYFLKVSWFSLHITNEHLLYNSLCPFFHCMLLLWFATLSTGMIYRQLSPPSQGKLNKQLGKVKNIKYFTAKVFFRIFSMVLIVNYSSFLNEYPWIDYIHIIYTSGKK